MPSLVSLAEEILAQAKQIDALLEQNNTPYPSFDNDTLATLPDEAQKIRKDLCDTNHTLQQLVRGARLSGLDIAFNWVDQLLLRIIWRYNLASAVPLDGSTATYEQIATRTGLRQSLVARTIRAAIPLHLFDEPHPGQVCHSAMSRLLVEDAGYRSVIGLQVADIGPASAKLIDAWERFGDDVGEPEKSAYALAHGGRGLFTVLAEEPAVADRFNRAMEYFARDPMFESWKVVEGFEWSTLDRPGARVVDLGGGYGQVSQTLARRTQHAEFLVQDRLHVIEEGRKRLAPELRDRVFYEGWDFLQEQKSENPPEAFLISRCLHNWSDSYCSVILRNLIPALRQGSKVLIWDVVLEDEPARKMSERFNFQQDFIMATISNGMDRTQAEFEHVFQTSDKRFKFNGVRRVEGSKISMIEVTWEE